MSDPERLSSQELRRTLRLDYGKSIADVGDKDHEELVTMLKELSVHPNPAELNVNQLKSTLKETYNIKPSELVGKSKTQLTRMLTSVRSSTPPVLVSSTPKPSFRSIISDRDLDLKLKFYALSGAIDNDDLALVQFLLSRGEDIDHVLILAAKHGKVDLIRYALQNGADIHYNDDIALVFAAEEGRVNAVKYLLENGADVNAQHGAALYFAIAGDHHEIVRGLISPDETWNIKAPGADIHIDNDGPLRLALIEGHPYIVKYLLANNADISSIDEEVLTIADANDHHDVVEYFLSVVE